LSGADDAFAVGFFTESVADLVVGLVPVYFLAGCFTETAFT